MASRQAKSTGTRSKRGRSKQQPKKRGRPPKHPDGLELTQTTLRLPFDVHRAARHHCIDEGLSMSDLVADLLREKLDL
jgi:hypothetical protein